jgi:hypothetical protein
LGTQAPPAGWYQDPGGPGLRYWDGAQWTQHVRSLDPGTQPVATFPVVAEPAPQPVAAGPPPGWHPDPTRRFELRYWDGTRWSDHVATSGGWRGTDPVGSGAPPAAAPGPGYGARDGGQPYGASPYAQPAARARSGRTPSWFAIAGGAAAIVGTLLPWLSASLTGRSANAFDVPVKFLFDPNNAFAGGINLGVILVVLGLAAVGLAFVPAAGVARRIVGAVIAAAVIVFVVQLLRAVSNDAFQLLGPGVWVTMVGGLVALSGK